MTVRRVQTTAHRNRVRREQQEQDDRIAAQAQVPAVRAGGAGTGYATAAQGAKADSAVQSIGAGANITVDNTDPQNPIISASGGGGAYAEGAAFPGSPAANDKFYRTDHNLLCYFDGTRWLSVDEYALAHMPGALLPLTATKGDFLRFPVRSDLGIYLTRWVVTTFVVTTNNGAQFWTVSLDGWTAANVFSATVSSFTTAADAPSTWVQHDQAINAVLAAAIRAPLVAVTKTSTPGNLYVAQTLHYRLIVT